MSAQHRKTYMFIIFLSTLLQWQYSKAVLFSSIKMFESITSRNIVTKTLPKVIKKGLFASPSWLGPAVQYTTYIASTGIAGYVLYNRYYSWRYPLMEYLEKNVEIPQNEIDKYDRKFLKNMLKAYNQQYKLNKDQSDLVEKLKHCKSTIKKTFYGL